MPGPRNGQHPPLEHVRHGRRAAPHGRQRLLQPPHLPVRRAALQADAVRNVGAQVVVILSESVTMLFGSDRSSGNVNVCLLIKFKPV